MMTFQLTRSGWGDSTWFWGYPSDMEDEGTVELRDSRRFDTNTNSGQISPQKLWKRASLFFLTGGGIFFLPLSLSLEISLGS